VLYSKYRRTRQYNQDKETSMENVHRKKEEKELKKKEYSLGSLGFFTD
jgi:hypothetical protein